MREISSAWKKKGETIGFVPTMGCLHPGHMSLVERAKNENSKVVLSIFVNPAQFAPGEDFERYPRDFERDEKFCKKKGVDIIFYPSAGEMYPAKNSTVISLPRLANKLCGKTRAGHFKGVTLVVTKLFNIISPQKAYFGQKDYQQYRIIQTLTDDLNFPTEIVLCPIVREESGLALSSRNIYLNKREKKAAERIYATLMKAKETTNMRELEEFLKEEELITVEYLKLVDSYTLHTNAKGSLVVIAAYVGKTRLIDNILL